MTSRFSGRAALALLVAGVGIHAAARADSQIYKCVDAQGRVEFTDANKPGCKALDLPGMIVNAPAQRAGRPARQGAAAPNPAATPANFPRVDSSVQRARDDDRRAILNDELRNEEKKLADLRREFNNGEPERQGNERNYAKYQERVAQMRDDIGRAEGNIESLKREIANIR
jgi:hypothetical protein